MAIEKLSAVSTECVELFIPSTKQLFTNFKNSYSLRTVNTYLTLHAVNRYIYEHTHTYMRLTLTSFSILEERPTLNSFFFLCLLYLPLTLVFFIVCSFMIKNQFLSSTVFILVGFLSHFATTSRFLSFLILP